MSGDKIYIRESDLEYHLSRATSYFLSIVKDIKQMLYERVKANR